MIYFIRPHNEVKSRVLSEISKLPNHVSWEVEIRELKTTRSKAQNNLYWKWCQIIGDEKGYTKDEMHESFATHYIGRDEYLTSFGQLMCKAKSTTKLTKKEFMVYMDKIQAYADDENITLPQPLYFGIE